MSLSNTVLIIIVMATLLVFAIIIALQFQLIDRLKFENKYLLFSIQALIQAIREQNKSSDKKDNKEN